MRGVGGIETEDINVNINAVLTMASPPLKGAYKAGCITLVAAGKRAASETLAGTGLTVVTARSGDATSTALFQAAAAAGLVQSVISSSGATSAATAVAAVVLAGT
jgi:methyl coenzyme M reductase beta subunit